MKWIAIVLGTALSCGVAAAEEEGERLTLREAVSLAVVRNLDIQAVLYNSASAEADIRKLTGIYNPVLQLLTRYSDLHAPLESSYPATRAPVYRLNSVVANAGVSKLTPTGATVGAAFTNLYNHNNSRYSGSTPVERYFESTLNLTVSQPLLKNFGRTNTELYINVARYDKAGSLEQLKSRVIDVVSNVMIQYNRLYSLHKSLEVKRGSVKLAELILEITREKVKAGLLPAMEISNAQYGLASQKKNLLDAERALKDQVGVLRVLLLLKGRGDVVPVDVLSRNEYKVDEAKLVERALATRPDLKQLRVYLQSSELQRRAAKNQILPDLNLDAGLILAGLAGSYNRDLERLGARDYPSWFAGFRFSYPLGNDAAKNELIKSKLKVEQIETQVRRLEENISNDVSTAVRAVEVGFLQLDVTAQGRAYAEEVLQAYLEKQKAGLSTTKDVLDELNDVVIAQSNEIQAVADFNNAIISLWRTTGELLERQGIVVGEKEADHLYAVNE